MLTCVIKLIQTRLRAKIGWWWCKWWYLSIRYFFHLMLRTITIFLNLIHNLLNLFNEWTLFWILLKWLCDLVCIFNILHLHFRSWRCYWFFNTTSSAHLSARNYLLLRINCLISLCTAWSWLLCRNCTSG